MTTPTKLGAFGLVLAAALAAGMVVGAAVGPIDVGDDQPRHAPSHATPFGGEH